MISSAVARRFVAVAGAVILGSSLVATVASAQPATPKTAPHAQLHYAINKQVCAKPKNPNFAQCYAVERVPAKKGAHGAYAYTEPSYQVGPAGGYTPADLAAAYGFDPTANRRGQTVAIVDWYDDPATLSDLNTFDHEYGLPSETSTSFRKVNEYGATKPLPARNQDASVEISLDIQSVRAVCHTCKILLIEANNGSDANLATAENTAVRLGATEISNSFGEPEHPVSKSVAAAYNHPGVVITAATGDNGWFGWDFFNNSGAYNSSQNGASFPSTLPTVVAVAGTTLQLNSDGTRAEEDVWNENGPDDEDGVTNVDGTLFWWGAQGASGGGCSTLYAAKAWQSAYPGYAQAGCNGKRLAADVAAIADPNTGFDVVDSFANPSAPWITIGGTSLASPVVAAMYALAGGAGGSAYPAASLYTNAASHPSSVSDITLGGSGYCAGDTTANCGNDVYNTFLDVNQNRTHNPNSVGAGNLDCSFPRDTSDPASPPPFSSECNAVDGYDGASGLGAPGTDGLFRSTAPSVTLTHPSSLRLTHAATFKAGVSEVISGAHATSYTWYWGDGHSTTVSSSSSSISTSHTYTRACSCTVTLSVWDSAHQQVIKTTHVTVGEHAHVHYAGPYTIHRRHSRTFSASGTWTPNTGAHIVKIHWNWGDHHTSNGTRVHHAYSRTGRYTVTLSIEDSTGVWTTVHHHVHVIR